MEVINSLSAGTDSSILLTFAYLTHYYGSSQIPRSYRLYFYRTGFGKLTCVAIQPPFSTLTVAASHRLHRATGG